MVKCEKPDCRLFYQGEYKCLWCKWFKRLRPDRYEPIKQHREASMKKHLIALALALVLLLPMAAQAAGVTVLDLSWQPNTELNLAGYKIYLRNAHVPSQTILLKTVGKKASNIPTLTFTLPSSGTYVLVMTAFNQAGVEGLPSAPAINRATGKRASWSAKGAVPATVKGLGFAQ